MNWGRNVSNNGIIGMKSVKGYVVLAYTNEKTQKEYRPHITFSVMDTGGKKELVKVYMESQYNKGDKIKVPVKVALYSRVYKKTGSLPGWDIFSKTNRGQKIGSKSGSGYVVEAGKYNTRSGVPNKSYIKSAWKDSAGNILKIKLYYDSVYTDKKGKTCVPVRVFAYKPMQYKRDYSYRYKRYRG